MVDDVQIAFGKAEDIGVIGSPSSTSQMMADILGTAVNRKLIGNLGIFHYIQDNKDHYAIGQITEVSMQNIWTQDPTMRGLIRQRGRVDPVTERQDIHAAKLMISAVFGKNKNGFEQSIFGTVPSTGTPIRLISENIMNSLLKSYVSELFYLGRAYETDIKMPMWFKHFGDEKDDQEAAGEGYHIGIFGKNGSGKSVLARMMMLGYARHEKMSIVVLDPQGDFTKDFNKYSQITKQYKALNKDIEMYPINKLVLDDYDLFAKMLAKSRFWDGLVRSSDYRIKASNILVDYIRRGKYELNDKKSSLDEFVDKTKSTSENKKKLPKRIPINQYYKEDIFKNIVWKILEDKKFQGDIYSAQYQREFKMGLERGTDDFYQRWITIAKLFTWEGRGNKAITINRLVNDHLFKDRNNRKPFVVLDLSKETLPEGLYWDDEIQILIIKGILDKVVEVAEEYYKDDNLLNCLVVIDEAHRFAPRGKIEDESLRGVKETLIDAVRTTRKYGLGWMFISQTLSSLDKDIINQIRIFTFGFGLAWGLERQALREIIGGQKEALSLYQMFKDPQSSLGDKKYSFMSIGPISPLSFSDSPLFFSVLKYPDEFLKINFE